MLALGFLKLDLGNEDAWYLSIRGFLTFSCLNQLKIHFNFWKAEVVIFICSLTLGLILEPLKYSENPLESTGESSNSFKYGDLEFFSRESVCKSLIYGIWTPTCHGPSWWAVGQHL